MTATEWAEVVASGVRLATPIALAAIGEAIAERAGVLNLGIEGTMLAGAFAAFAIAAATGSVGLGLVAAIAAGLALALLLSLFVIDLGTDQVVAGVALNLLAFGLTGVCFRALWGETGTTLAVPGLLPVELPVVSHLRFVGVAFFTHEPLVWMAALTAGLASFGLWRSSWGLETRAVGDHPLAADVAGVDVLQTRRRALLFAGALAGLAGADLVLAHARTFSEGITMGRGFLALAIVILGRRGPVGVALAALLFGGAEAVDLALQARHPSVARARELVLALPYALTLAALALAGGKRPDDPAALGVPYKRA